MAHGRKRCFIAGFVCGGFVAGAIVLALISFAWITIEGTGKPLFRESALEAAKEWARIDAFPEGAKDLDIRIGGTSFTRLFTVTFWGDSEDIENWVKGYPGVSDPKCEIWQTEDGGEKYVYPAAGGTIYAEIVHWPSFGKVRIHTTWS
ncbi:MAG: hypothetical protein AAGA58_17065 [Verrucomicrobiota bacterium]